MIQSKTADFSPLVRALFIGGALCVSLGLLIWALLNYQAPPISYGPRAVFTLISVTVFLSLLGRILLLRMLKMEASDVKKGGLPVAWRMLFLLDVAAPLYLAAGVLIGVPAAILVALVSQIIVQCYTVLRGFVSLTQAAYHIVVTALLVFLADSLYTLIAGSHQNQYIANALYQPTELFGSIVAALVMLFLFVLVSFPLVVYIFHDEAHAGQQAASASLLVPLQAYLRSQVFRYQLLVLSVGPLLPVVDFYDNVVAELAWVFFLVPLFAIYYLALVSTRLTIRTDALQQTLLDLSSARRRQDELRDYASLITRVQEEERRRLARELHDDTAQALIALSLGLDGLARAMGNLNLPEKDAAWLSNLQNLADHTLEGVRRACRDLRPSVLDDLGLRAALEWLSDSSSSRGIPCTFRCTGTPVPIASEREIAIFRIVQEALSNIWRHAQATHAAVEMSYEPERLRVAITDDGKGFDAQDALENVHKEGSLGLVGMRERAMLIGATLTITSHPGKGCVVYLTLPLATAANGSTNSRTTNKLEIVSN
ncbi:MAG TPA: sensor histidine kinase [Ktedonobacteraceae bacterium]|jgi:signal transduction histidine kinase|nr:sensor histidine kinase [Ktedonobacteraceae bacterium]